MIGSKKDNSVVMLALAASTGNHHTTAAYLFQDAGNQMRDPKEKQMLWDAAAKARRAAASD